MDSVPSLSFSMSLPLFLYLSHFLFLCFTSSHFFFLHPALSLCHSLTLSLYLYLSLFFLLPTFLPFYSLTHSLSSPLSLSLIFLSDASAVTTVTVSHQVLSLNTSFRNKYQRKKTWQLNVWWSKQPPNLMQQPWQFSKERCKSLPGGQRKRLQESGALQGKSPTPVATGGNPFLTWNEARHLGLVGLWSESSQHILWVFRHVLH